MKESKADKMFEDLGYKKINGDERDFYAFKYYKNNDNVICFYKMNEFFENSFCKSGEHDGMCDYTTMQELAAINEKCKELGWLN